MQWRRASPVFASTSSALRIEFAGDVDRAGSAFPMFPAMTFSSNRWLLPEGVEELLPQQAEHLERLRQQLLVLFHSWGYELVMPPLVEYVESLLLGRGDELDLQTFKLTDQLNGRLLGVRADITPQVARIDAHRMQREGPNRLCYVGQVLRTRPEGLMSGREPIQVGAELYGHRGLESDIEVLQLMVEALMTLDVRDIHIDIGHVTIFRTLARRASMTTEDETILFRAMQRKAKADMLEALDAARVVEPWRGLFLQLVDLNGGPDVLHVAKQVLKDVGPEVDAALCELAAVADEMDKRVTVPLHFDLAELRGYHYKTGLVFAAFVPGHGQEVARGGRYDAIGRAYGRARPATGFSTDLKTLVHLSTATPYAARGIFAPYDDKPDLRAHIRALRAKGERVVVALPGQTVDGGCDRELVWRADAWQVVALKRS